MSELKLAKKFQNIIQDFITQVKNIYADGLISIILYGSAASGEFVDKHSNINLLIILSNTDPPNLNKISATVRKNKFRILNTLFFTPDYIKSSTDVFPIEFLDMKENYVVLWGQDILKDLKVDIKNLRFQCEQELKAKLINLKRSYLRNQNKRALKNLLLKSFNSTLHILRNLVRLKGKIPSYLKVEILKEIAGEFPINIAIFNKILEVKNKNLRLTYNETEGLFFNFVREVENLIDIVDRT